MLSINYNYSLNFWCIIRLYALKKIQLDESRKTRTKEAVQREAKWVEAIFYSFHTFNLIFISPTLLQDFVWFEASPHCDILWLLLWSWWSSPLHYSGSTASYIHPIQHKHAFKLCFLLHHRITAMVALWMIALKMLDRYFIESLYPIYNYFLFPEKRILFWEADPLCE